MHWVYLTVSMVLFVAMSFLLLYFRSYFRLSWIGTGVLLLLLGIADFTLPFLKGVGDFTLILIPLLFIPIVYFAPRIGREKRFANLPTPLMQQSVDETAASRENIWMIDAKDEKEKSGKHGEN